MLHQLQRVPAASATGIGIPIPAVEHAAEIEKGLSLAAHGGQRAQRRHRAHGCKFEFWGTPED
jgi:hypothetical protein